MTETAETVAQVITMLLVVASFFGVQHYGQLSNSPQGRFARRMIKWATLGFACGTFFWMLAPDRFTWTAIVFPTVVITTGLWGGSEFAHFIVPRSILLPAVAAAAAGAALGALLHMGTAGLVVLPLYGLIAGIIVSLSESRLSSSSFS